MPSMGAISLSNKGKKCLALDLDETLVHSSFQLPHTPTDYKIPVTIEGKCNCKDEYVVLLNDYQI